VSDEAHMRRALELAARVAGLTAPNPAVGCVILKNGVIVGEAATAPGGRPHAEEQALALAGANARGATAYVTLEPCAQRSSGALSCSDLLLQAGVSRVVIAALDPHPLANGIGPARLKAAGIGVEQGLLSDEALAQNADFFASIGRA